MTRDPPNGPTWVVPFEAVRSGAHLAESVTLALLAGRSVRFQPHARVELGPLGFMAVIEYVDPVAPSTVHRAVIQLAWGPVENAVMWAAK